MRPPVKFIAVIVLISVLSLVSGIPLLHASPIRQPTLLATSYPKSLSWRVRKDLARRVGIPTNELRVTEAERKTWNDGCLELAKETEFCTAQLVEGWRVVVTNGDRSWVYHTDLKARTLRLADPSQRATLPKNVVFRSQSSGGFAGQTYEVVLFSDGRMEQRINVTDQKAAPLRSWKIPRDRVQKFQELLKGEHFEQFDSKKYSAPNGAADFFVVTLTSPDGMVEYVDIEEGKLPRSLKTIIQAWNALK